MSSHKIVFSWRNKNNTTTFALKKKNPSYQELWHHCRKGPYRTVRLIRAQLFKASLA